VRHVTCQPIGQAAFDEGLAGIACRSAVDGARPADEELGVFDRVAGTDLRMTGRRPFADWYLGDTA
jgi:hypothetical protein